MDLLIKLMGGKKNGTDRTAVFDMPTLMKNITLAMLTALSLAFTAGNYFSATKDLPVRMDTVERKQDRVDAKLEAILSNQAAAAADIRELRACMLGRDR